MGKPPAMAERLTFSIDDTPAGGTLCIDWEHPRHHSVYRR
jgi:hypothetical protein